eukprot:scaffold283571_cov19-Prasinocladus_malaysianus.AAC.1
MHDLIGVQGIIKKMQVMQIGCLSARSAGMLGHKPQVVYHHPSHIWLHKDDAIAVQSPFRALSYPATLITYYLTFTSALGGNQAAICWKQPAFTALYTCRAKPKTGSHEVTVASGHCWRLEEKHGVARYIE